MADFKYFGGNYIYADAGTGNDANAGTISSPKRTITGAVNVASNNDTIIVGTGRYEHIESVGGFPQGISIIGDGFVLFDGTSAPTGNAIKEVLKIKNITFYNYNTVNSNAAIEFTNLSNNNPIEIQNCNFYGCDFVNSRNSWNYMKDCVFQDCTFDGVIGTEQLQRSIQNCTFVSCTGQLGNAPEMTYGVFNNTYTDCETMSHLLLSGSAPEFIPSSKMNYCNIDGEFMYGTQAQIKALGTNISGSSFLSTSIFNDYVDIATRPISEWWKQAYTQKSTSPVLSTGRNGTHVGRYYESLYYNAGTLWNDYFDDEFNSELTGETINLIPGNNDGFVFFVDVPTDGKALSRLIVNNNNEYGANGELTGYLWETDNIAPAEKSSVNVGMIIDDQIPGGTTISIDNYWYQLYIAEISGGTEVAPFLGTANNDMSLVSQSLGFVPLKNDLIDIHINLKTP